MITLNLFDACLMFFLERDDNSMCRDGDDHQSKSAGRQLLRSMWMHLLLLQIDLWGQVDKRLVLRETGT